MLVAASAVGGLPTPLGMALLARLAQDPEVMGTQPISAGLATAEWVAVAMINGTGVFVAASAAAGIH
jgi:Mn2+/Fe2+ NRAMP family transporter